MEHILVEGRKSCYVLLTFCFSGKECTSSHLFSTFQCVHYFVSENLDKNLVFPGNNRVDTALIKKLGRACEGRSKCGMKQRNSRGKEEFRCRREVR